MKCPHCTSAIENFAVRIATGSMHNGGKVPYRVVLCPECNTVINASPSDLFDQARALMHAMQIIEKYEDRDR